MSDLQTPLTIEDLIETLSGAEEKLRRMRALAGSQPISVHAFLSVILAELKELHDKRINVDKVLAATRAAQQRAARDLPLPPTRPPTPKEAQ